MLWPCIMLRNLSCQLSRYKLYHIRSKCQVKFSHYNIVLHGFCQYIISNLGGSSCKVEKLWCNIPTHMTYVYRYREFSRALQISMPRSRAVEKLQTWMLQARCREKSYWRCADVHLRNGTELTAWRVRGPRCNATHATVWDMDDGHWSADRYRVHTRVWWWCDATP